MTLSRSRVVAQDNPALFPEQQLACPQCSHTHHHTLHFSAMQTQLHVPYIPVPLHPFNIADPQHFTPQKGLSAQFLYRGPDPQEEPAPGRATRLSCHVSASSVLTAAYTPLAHLLITSFNLDSSASSPKSKPALLLAKVLVPLATAATRSAQVQTLRAFKMTSESQKLIHLHRGRQAPAAVENHSCGTP